MQNTPQYSSKAKKLARRLLRENRHGRSYRSIARDDYGNAFSHAVLVRIANSGGEWMPKDQDILTALGIIKPRKPRTQQPTPIFDMATSALADALRNRREMPPVDPRIIREFKKLGWIKRTAKQ